MQDNKYEMVARRIMDEILFFHMDGIEESNPKYHRIKEDIQAVLSQELD